MTSPAQRDELGRFLTEPKRVLRSSDRRRLERVKRERFRLSRLVPLIKRMSLIPLEEREWRIRLIIGVDDRSLTGKLMGDPQFLRSALYFHTLKEEAR